MIEYSSDQRGKDAHMASSTGHKNKVNYQDDPDQEYQSYSDDEHEDMNAYMYYSEDELYSTENDDDLSVYKSIEVSDEEDNVNLLKDPTSIFAFPARVLPSVEEMNAEYEEHIKTTQSKNIHVMSAIIKAGWIIRHNKAVEDKRRSDLMKWHQEQVTAWRRRVSGHINGVYNLQRSYRSWDDDVKMMRIHTEMFVELHKEFRYRAEKIRGLVAIAKTEANKIKADNLRRKKQLGMNKKSDAHKATATGSLVLKGMDSIKDKAVLIAANLEKKKSKARALELWKEENKRSQAIAALNPKPKVIVIDYDIKNDDEIEIEVDEDIDKIGLDIQNEAWESIIKTREANAEKVKDDTEKRENEEDEKHFISTMTKCMGLKVYKKSIPVVENKVNNLLELGFIGLIAQKQKQRGIDDIKYAKRIEGFAVLADKTKLEQVLTCTTLCKSVTTKKKCYHKNCRFAHSIEDLKQRECVYGVGCGFVKKMENGQYENRKFGRTGKTCSAMHPGEHKHGFCNRIGLKYNDNKNSIVQSPVYPVIVDEKYVPSLPSDFAVHMSFSDEEECNTPNTPSWSDVVFKSLTDDEKTKLYGKGLELITKQGYIDGIGLGKETTGIVDPISITDCNSIRMPWCRIGIGYTGKSCVSVTDPGFNWVKGCVLQPVDYEKRKRHRKIRWDVKPTFMVAVEALNNKIVSRTNDILISTVVANAKAKAVEINDRIRSENLLSTVVANAKAKAVEINYRLENTCTRIISVSVRPTRKKHDFSIDLT